MAARKDLAAIRAASTEEYRRQEEERRWQDEERRRQEGQRRYRELVGLREICRRRTKTLVRKGLLVKEPCEWCQATVVQAHHEDYERPDLVRWLCRPHHDAVHHEGLILPVKVGR